MSDKFKTKVGYYKVDVILISVSVITVMVAELFGSRSHYMAGLHGNAFYAIHIFICWILPLIGLSIILALVNLVRIIVAAFKIKKMQWLRAMLSLTPILVYCVLFFTDHSETPGAVDFLRGYEKWVQKEVDIASIQKWLTSLDPAYSGKSYFYASDFPEELPKFITKFKPYHMDFGTFDDGKRSVEFEWGNALGHFGIKIGLPDMETPKEGCIKHSGSLWEYIRPIQPGVYIFDRG